MEIKRCNYWIRLIIYYLVHNLVQSYSLSKLPLKSSTVSPTPSQACRRRFLKNIAVISAAANVRPSSAETIPYLQNFKYYDDWVGTSLKILSVQDAASWKDQVFPFGHWPDPILRRKASLIHFEQIDRNDLEKIAMKLRTTARDKGAVGLAAQQW